MSDARAGRVGTTINGKWQIDARIGTGGMATVYAATHRNGARAAIKMLHGQLSRDPSTRARFLREGYAANAVRHPGVVAVLDDGVAEDGSAFLVLELLEGETLDSRRERLGGKLPLEDVLELADQALDALAAAHKSGVIHRDVKPENLFVTTEGRVKLLDFGLARMKDAQAEATKTGVTIGTPEFMPPEQAMGRRDAVDARSDVWGLGATLFTALTGRYVHEDAQTIHEQLVASATQRSRPIRQLAPHVPIELAKVIDRALELEMDDRWQSAGEMQAALRAAHPSIVPSSPRSSEPRTNRQAAPFSHEASSISSDQTMRLPPESPPSRSPNAARPRRFADDDMEETFVEGLQTLKSRGVERGAPRGGIANARAPESDKTSRMAPQRSKVPEPRHPAPRESNPPPTPKTNPSPAWRQSFHPVEYDDSGVPSRRMTQEEAMEPTMATPRAYLQPGPAHAPSPQVRSSPMGLHAAPSPAYGPPPHPMVREHASSPNMGDAAAHYTPEPLPAVARRERQGTGRIIALVSLGLIVVCLFMGAYVMWRTPPTPR